MGVDVNGIAPVNESGEWVGYSNLIWGSVWDLCVNITPLLRRLDRDWDHGGDNSFTVGGNEHKQLKQQLKKVLKEPNINRQYRKYLNYLEKNGEHEQVLKTVHEFSEFINNNEGFVVS